MKKILNISPICEKIAQLRLLPNFHKIGNLIASTAGAHNHLNEYGNLTNANAPIAL
jgi:hypothetical protein